MVEPSLALDRDDGPGMLLGATLRGDKWSVAARSKVNASVHGARGSRVFS